MQIALHQPLSHARAQPFPALFRTTPCRSPCKMSAAGLASHRALIGSHSVVRCSGGGDKKQSGSGSAPPLSKANSKNTMTMTRRAMLVGGVAGGALLASPPQPADAYGLNKAPPPPTPIFKQLFSQAQGDDTGGSTNPKQRSYADIQRAGASVVHVSFVHSLSTLERRLILRFKCAVVCIHALYVYIVHGQTLVARGLNQTSDKAGYT